MGFWSKLVILALAALAFFYVKVNFFDTPHAKVEKKLVVEEQVAEPVKKVEPTENKKQEEEKNVTKTYVTVYFLGTALLNMKKVLVFILKSLKM